MQNLKLANLLDSENIYAKKLAKWRIGKESRIYLEKSRKSVESTNLYIGLRRGRYEWKAMKLEFIWRGGEGGSKSPVGIPRRNTVHGLCMMIKMHWNSRILREETRMYVRRVGVYVTSCVIFRRTSRISLHGIFLRGRPQPRRTNRASPRVWRCRRFERIFQFLSLLFCLTGKRNFTFQTIFIKYLFYQVEK